MPGKLILSHSQSEIANTFPQAGNMGSLLEFIQSSLPALAFGFICGTLAKALGTLSAQSDVALSISSTPGACSPHKRQTTYNRGDIKFTFFPGAVPL